MRSELSRRPSGSFAARIRALLLRASILCVAWWALNEGELGGAAIGAAGIGIALVVSIAVSPVATTWRLGGVLRLALRFIAGSVRGGIDVARRALARTLPLSPTMIRFPVRLMGRSARELFAGAISLMPGTLSVSLDGSELDVHLLVDDPRARHQLARLEESIAAAVGEALEATHG